MRRHLKSAGRLLAAPLLALLMLAAGVVATATAAQAADSGAWTFSNPDGTLNATGTGDGAQVSVTPDGTNYTNWRLIPAGTGAFRVANTNTGKCLYSTQPLTQRSCGVGDTEDGQLWHFHPVNGKPGTFMLVRDDNNYCLDNRGGLHLWGILAQPNPCDGSSTQAWTVSQAKAPEALKLALDYYSQLCTKDTSTCSWTQKSEGPLEVLPRVKASSVWYNDTSEKVAQVFTTIYHSGWSQSLSAGVSVSAGISVPIQTMISSQMSSTITYTSDEAQVNGVIVTVPPKNYGWVDFAAVGKKVTGTWTFDAGRFPWTADATVTVPVVDSPAGSTMYVAHTGTTPPGATPPSEDPVTGEAETHKYATTASKTYTDLPQGTHLASYRDGGAVQIVDGTGHAIATMQPGEVIDAQGKSHAYKVSVNGNAVTQTLQDAPGASIEGTETSPLITMNGPGAFVPPSSNAAAPAKVKSSAGALMQPQDRVDDGCEKYNGHRCSADELAKYKDHLKKLDDWDKCVAKNTLATAAGGAAGGVVTGPGGILVGGVLGMIGGAAAGMIICSF